MAKGKAKSTLLGIQGVVGHSNAPDWSFLYDTSTILNPNYNVGDRVVLPDGRVFRYAKASNIISNILMGVKFYSLGAAEVGYKAATAAAIGDKEITIDAGDSGDYTADQFRGGYLIIHTHTDYNHQFRGIIGNTASDADGNVTFYLDAPLTHTITTSHGVEVHANPYANVRLIAAHATPGGADQYSSVAGIPNVKTAAADQYLWIQTWGPIFVNPHIGGGFGTEANSRQVVFDYEGSIINAEDFNGTACSADSEYQTAGFIIYRTTEGAGSCIVNLQINP